MELQLLDSTPLKNISQGQNLRFIYKLNKTHLYNNFSSASSKKSYKKHADVAVLNFIKGLLAEPPLFNLHREELNSYQKIVDYIKLFKKDNGLKVGNIARLKHSTLNVKTVPRNKHSIEFVEYVKLTFNNFDEHSFYKSE